MEQSINNNRWGTQEQQAVMYKNNGKKVAITSLSNAEKLCYPALKVGMIVEIDHQYSPDNTDIYVSIDGEIIGRVSVKNVVFVKSVKLPKHAKYLGDAKSKAFYVMNNAKTGICYLVDKSMSCVIKIGKDAGELYSAF